MYTSREGSKADGHCCGIEDRVHRAQENVAYDPGVDPDVLADNSGDASCALRGKRRIVKIPLYGTACREKKQLTPRAVRPRFMSARQSQENLSDRTPQTPCCFRVYLTLLRDLVLDVAEFELRGEGSVTVVGVIAILEWLCRRDLCKERLGLRGGCLCRKKRAWEVNSAHFPQELSGDTTHDDEGRAGAAHIAFGSVIFR